MSARTGASSEPTITTSCTVTPPSSPAVRKERMRNRFRGGGPRGGGGSRGGGGPRGGGESNGDSDGGGF